MIATPHAEALERAEHNVFGELGNVKQLYFEGDLEASVAISGQVIGRIEGIAPVSEIIEGIVEEFHATLDALHAAHRR